MHVVSAVLLNQFTAINNACFYFKQRRFVLPFQKTMTGCKRKQKQQFKSNMMQKSKWSSSSWVLFELLDSPKNIFCMPSKDTLFEDALLTKALTELPTVEKYIEGILNSGFSSVIALIGKGAIEANCLQLSMHSMISNNWVNHETVFVSQTTRNFQQQTQGFFPSS